MQCLYGSKTRLGCVAVFGSQTTILLHSDRAIGSVLSPPRTTHSWLHCVDRPILDGCGQVYWCTEHCRDAHWSGTAASDESTANAGGCSDKSSYWAPAPHPMVGKIPPPLTPQICHMLVTLVIVFIFCGPGLPVPEIIEQLQLRC